jgi:hypothetical protein
MNALDLHQPSAQPQSPAQSQSPAQPQSPAQSSPSAQPGSAVLSRPAWQLSIAAGAGALAVIELYGAVARMAGVPMSAAAFGAHTASHVNAGSLAFGVALGTFVGTVLAVLFARKAARPARAFLLTAVALVALSLTGPLTATHATLATKLTLACGHLIAAAIIIPVVTRRLGRRQHLG